MEQQFLTREEVAQVLRVSLRTIDHLLAGRQIASVTIGRRRLIPRDAVEGFAQAQRKAAHLERE